MSDLASSHLLRLSKFIGTFNFQNNNSDLSVADCSLCAKKICQVIYIVTFMVYNRVSQRFFFSMTVTKTLEKSTYKEERFVLAPSFRSFSPWLVALRLLGLWQGAHGGASCSLCDS